MFRPRTVAECPCCCGSAFDMPLTYTAPPRGEAVFSIAGGGGYNRAYYRCRACGHLVSSLELDTMALYREGYVVSHYGGREGIRRAYTRIMSLPPAASDNRHRAACVASVALRILNRPAVAIRILDIGSGTGVFPAAMKELGFPCTALEPDPQACAHLREELGIDAVQGLLEEAAIAGSFDVVTLNKVVEHGNSPAAMLRRAAGLLSPGGMLYVEVPDGEAALAEGAGREEFFIDHVHVFSAASLALTAVRAGQKLISLERLREPSTKFTLRAFMSPEL